MGDTVKRHRGFNMVPEKGMRLPKKSRFLCSRINGSKGAYQGGGNEGRGSFVVKLFQDLRKFTMENFLLHPFTREVSARNKSGGKRNGSDRFWKAWEGSRGKSEEIPVGENDNIRTKLFDKTNMPNQVFRGNGKVIFGERARGEGVVNALGGNFLL